MEVKEKEEKSTELIETSKDKKFVPVDYDSKDTSKVLKITGIYFSIFLLILIIAFCIFTYINSRNINIIHGVYIKGINVAGITKSNAKLKIAEEINSSIPDEIKITHNDFETSIAKDQLSIRFNIDEAVEKAYSIGRNGNIFQNNFTILKALFSHVDIEPEFSIDEEQLTSSIKDISNKLPDRMIEASCYIDDDTLVINKGTEGAVVNIDETFNYIKTSIENLEIKDGSLELITENKSPTEIDIDYVYSQVHKEPVNASFTPEPYNVVPSENGLDLAVSLDEVKTLLQEEKTEYEVPLKVLYPSVTTNMLGMEAFPDLLSQFSTKYAVSNKNRTTNLILAANKINGTVLMPGEIFSYNQVVGARTIAAGYKEAPIYVQGKVEDGLGGGICQITTTLYNAALFANLEIIERSNHQFVPSYANASRDATVVYGSLDFKFKNNRDYPIKLVCSVANGTASFQIYGMKSENDYNVEISSKVTKTTSTAIYSEAYKTLKKNGAVVSTEVISRDTYKRH